MPLNNQSQNQNKSNVFGTFSHVLPEPPVSTKSEPEPDELEPTPGILPDEPVVSHKTGLVLVPSIRLDGDPKSKPWNKPEAELWTWLREAEIELVEERVLDGASGAFWVRIRDIKRGVRSAILKFDGISINCADHQRRL